MQFSSKKKLMNKNKDEADKAKLALSNFLDSENDAKTAKELSSLFRAHLMITGIIVQK